MMFLLIGDVPEHRIGVGLADTERAVSSLPSKLESRWPSIMDPFRRIRLQYSHSIRQSQNRRQLDQQVHVVNGSVDKRRFSIEFS